MFSLLAGLIYLAAIVLPIWLLFHFHSTAWYWHVAGGDCGAWDRSGPRNSPSGDHGWNVSVRVRVPAAGGVGNRGIAAGGRPAQNHLSARASRAQKKSGCLDGRRSTLAEVPSAQRRFEKLVAGPCKAPGRLFLRLDVVAEDETDLSHGAGLVRVGTGLAERRSRREVGHVYPSQVAADEESALLIGRGDRERSSGAARTVHQVDRVRIAGRAGDVFPSGPAVRIPSRSCGSAGWRRHSSHCLWQRRWPRWWERWCTASRAEQSSYPCCRCR